MLMAKKGGGLRTRPRLGLGTMDLKDGDSTAGGMPNRGETGSNTTDPSSFLTNTGAGETVVVQNTELSSG